MRRFSCYSRYIRALSVALLACCVAAGSASVRVQACTLDQKPSMSANGLLARINKVTPTTQAQLATWTFFIFGNRYRAGRKIVFSENRRDVARALSAEAMRQPWGWEFGDGKTAYGATVRHIYAHPGRWPIKVFVWDPAGGRWDLFDQATITITVR